MTKAQKAEAIAAYNAARAIYDAAVALERIQPSAANKDATIAAWNAKEEMAKIALPRVKRASYASRAGMRQARER